MRDAVTDFNERAAMDTWLDNLQTLMMCLSQRRMTDDQLDRFARLLAGAEADAIERVRHTRRRAA